MPISSPGGAEKAGGTEKALIEDGVATCHNDQLYYVSARRVLAGVKALSV